MYLDSRPNIHALYLVIFYIYIKFVECSVNLKINCGARKLVQTPQIKKNKKKKIFVTVASVDIPFFFPQ